MLHGFGSNTQRRRVGGGRAKCFAALGYVALRFDMRGCGESEGERGRVICLEQVEDTRNARRFLATRPEVDPRAHRRVGHSFGAAVAVYAGGVDERVAAVHLVGRLGRRRDEVPQAARVRPRPGRSSPT